MTRNPMGAPFWFTLATRDRDRAEAVRFYSNLLGWMAHDAADWQGGGTALMCEGRVVAVCHDLAPDPRNQPVRPHWRVYFRVADVVATTARALQLGGRMLEVGPNPGQVTLMDPEGAAFGLLEVAEAICPAHADGPIGWVELASHDTAAAAHFYGALLGWEIRASTFGNLPAAAHLDPHGPEALVPAPATGTYRLAGIDGRDLVGLLPLPAAWRESPHWALHFRVSSCDAAIEALESLGGTLCSGPVNVPGVGRMATARDPQGALFHLLRFDPPDMG